MFDLPSGLGSRYLLILLLALGTLCSAAGQVPVVQWNRVIGGDEYDGLTSLQRTTDGGYLLGGSSRSGISGSKSEACRGREDFWVVKINAAGVKQWDRTFGGDNWDWLMSLQQTADGGYILGGYSESRVSGDRTAPGHIGVIGLPSSDFWVVKLDAQGNKQWDQAYGGTDSDLFYSLQQTRDGGYILGGKSYSGQSGDRTEPSRGGADYWVVKIDAQGHKQWDHAYGGSSEEGLQSLQQTQDGGYILGGHSLSGVSGDRTRPNQGSQDFWVVKIDAQGHKQWDRAYGGNANDILRSLQQTHDGGYVLAGYSDSNISGDKTQNHYGNNSGYNYDFWIVKTDAAGTLQWEKTYGGLAIEDANVVRQTSDGGYVVGGVSTSGASGDKTQPHKGNANGYEFDYWLLKLTATGAKQWDLTFGGVGDDHLKSVEQTSDGGYLLGGASGSGVSADKTQPNQGAADFWIIKLGPASPPTTSPITISGDSVLCPGRALTLTAQASPAPASYRWSTGATTPSITVNQVGMYSVVATYSGGLTSTAQHPVRSIPSVALPNFSLGPDTTVCAGGSVLLRVPPPAPGLSYRWSDGATATTLLVQQSGTYSLEIRSACDSRTLTRMVRFEPCLNIPNIITPNGDLANEHFFIRGLASEQWQLELYNRWGKRVYQTTHYKNNWGPGAAAGMYYYVLQQAGTTTRYTGWLQVAR